MSKKARMIFTVIAEYPTMDTALAESKNMIKKPNDINRNEDELRAGKEKKFTYKGGRGEKIMQAVRFELVD